MGLWVKIQFVTDNKAFVQLLSNPLSRMPARIERLSLRLQQYQYQYQIFHISRTDNVSDYLSRHPVSDPTEDDNQTKHYINFIVDVTMPKAIKLKQIEHVTMADPVLSKVAEFVLSGDWREAHGRPEFMPYIKIKDELSVNSEHNVILDGTKIVLTLALTDDV